MANISRLNNKMDITGMNELLASGFSSTAPGILRAGIDVGVGVIILGREKLKKVWECIIVPWNAPAGRKILQIDYNLGQNGSSKNEKKEEQTVRKFEKHLLKHRSGSLRGIPPYMKERKNEEKEKRNRSYSVTAEEEADGAGDKFQLGCGKPATMHCGHCDTS